MKIPPLRAELFHADGRTDRMTDATKLIVNFRSFANARKKTDQLVLYGEIMAVCSEIHTKHINTLCGQNVELYIKTQSVPRSKHTPSRL